MLSGFLKALASDVQVITVKATYIS